VFRLLNIYMNLFVIAGAKLTPLLHNSSFLFAFFYHFLNFEFNLLNNRALKTKKNLTAIVLLASRKEKQSFFESLPRSYNNQTKISGFQKQEA
jgi:hypothetical protein